jgi:hypothetical protein
VEQGRLSGNPDQSGSGVHGTLPAPPRFASLPEADEVLEGYLPIDVIEEREASLLSQREEEPVGGGGGRARRDEPRRTGVNLGKARVLGRRPIRTWPHR